MTTNAERADWAWHTVRTFCDMTREGPFSRWLKSHDDHADLIADLIADLGHHAEEYGHDYKQLLERGAGMWSAERRAPLTEYGNEPEGANDTATLEITLQT